MLHTDTHEYVKRKYNVNKIFIYNIEIPKHKNTYDSLVQLQNFFFYYLWVKRFFDRRRGTIFLCWLFHLPPSRAAPIAHKFVSPRPGLTLNFTDFSRISANASGAWRLSHPWSYNLSRIFIVTSLNDTSAPRAREHLGSCLYLTDQCTESKGSQPN